MDIFRHAFMINALFAAAMVAVMMPLVGSVIVLRRLAPVGDALSHSALAGVAVGLAMGRSPVAAAVACAVAAALLIEGLRRVYPHYAELSTSVVTALGVGLAAVVSGFVKSPSGFSAFLFGSIVALSKAEMAAAAAMCAIVVCASILLYRPILYIAFDEEGAGAAGVKVRLVNVVFTVLTAVTVSVASRAVGALIVSSLMTLPAACAMLISRSYRSNMLLAVGFGFAFTMAGMFIAYYADWKPGGAITLTGVAALALVIALRAAATRKRRRGAAINGANK